MSVEVLKKFLNEDTVIDSQEVLDYAFIKLSKKLSSEEINKKVKKILKKAKSKKDAFKKIDTLKEKLSNKNEDFEIRTRSYLWD